MWMPVSERIYNAFRKFIGPIDNAIVSRPNLEHLDILGEDPLVLMVGSQITFRWIFGNAIFSELLLVNPEVARLGLW